LSQISGSICAFAVRFCLKKNPEPGSCLPGSGTDILLGYKIIFFVIIPIVYARIGVMTRETRRFMAAELEIGCDSPNPIVVRRSGATPR